MRSSRGTTLVELMMSVAITAIVMTALVAVATVAVRLVRRTEQVVISNDASRLALEGLLRDVRLAGMGAPGGIWVVQGGAPVRINAVFGGPGDGGTDELWLAVPRPNVMSTGCNSAGGSATLTESGGRRHVDGHQFHHRSTHRRTHH
jgi:type II secretory pathway pseudopilin PulG